MLLKQLIAVGLFFLTSLLPAARANEQQIQNMLDIPFSAESQNVRRIDVFLPDANGNGCCIFFIHGGGWAAGDKVAWHETMEHFCRMGYVCTSVNYHLRPAFTLKKMVEDMRVAMSFVKSHANEWGFAADRVAVYGSSAGGHLAGMLATIQPEDELGMTPEVEIRDTKPLAVVCMCPVLSLPRYKKELIPQLLGADWPVEVALASPETRVCGKEPPFLIVVGTKDTATPLVHQQAMQKALEAKGGSVKIVVVPGAKHGSFYGVSNQVQKEALAQAESFLRSVFELP